MSDEIPDGFYDFDEVVREARATYTPEELARERELEERAEEQLELAELVYAMRTGAGMTQRELAEKQVALSHLSRLLNEVHASRPTTLSSNLRVRPGIVSTSLRSRSDRGVRGCPACLAWWRHLLSVTNMVTRWARLELGRPTPRSLSWVVGSSPTWGTTTPAWEPPVAPDGETGHGLVREPLHITHSALTRDGSHGRLSICALSCPR